jgi:hypothetical protein
METEPEHQQQLEEEEEEKGQLVWQQEEESLVAAEKVRDLLYRLLYCRLYRLWHGCTAWHLVCHQMRGWRYWQGCSVKR